MDTYIKELEDTLKSLTQKFQEELKTIRSNRPSVAVLEDVRVDYYGQKMSVKQLGSLSVRPPRDIEISVWDKNAIAPVMGAIDGAKLGLSLTNDGNVIRATLPQLTDERRAEFSKVVKKMAEAVRIQMRSRRDDTIKKLKSAEEDKKIGEDQVFKGKEKIQKIVDEVNGKIEAALEGKLKELNE